jgi:hypothetical protein
VELDKSFQYSVRRAAHWHRLFPRKSNCDGTRVPQLNITLRRDLQYSRGWQNENDVAAQFVGFMQQFLEVFNELKGKNFYATGESVSTPFSLEMLALF